MELRPAVAVATIIVVMSSLSFVDGAYVSTKAGGQCNNATAWLDSSKTATAPPTPSDEVTIDGPITCDVGVTYTSLTLTDHASFSTTGAIVLKPGGAITVSAGQTATLIAQAVTADLKLGAGSFLALRVSASIAFDRIYADDGSTINATLSSDKWAKLTLMSGSLTMIGLQTTPTATISGSLVLKGASSIAGTLNLGSIVCADQCTVGTLSIADGTSIAGLLSVSATNTLTCIGSGTGFVGGGSVLTNISSPAGATLTIGCPLHGPLTFDSAVKTLTLTDPPLPLDITSGPITLPDLKWSGTLTILADHFRNNLTVASVTMSVGDSIVLDPGATLFIASASTLQGTISGADASPPASSFVICNGKCAIDKLLAVLDGVIVGGKIDLNGDFTCSGGGGIGPVQIGELTAGVKGGGIDFRSGSCVVRAPFPFEAIKSPILIDWPRPNGGLTLDLSSASQLFSSLNLTWTLIASGRNSLILDKLVMHSDTSIYAERGATIAIAGASTVQGSIASLDRTGVVTIAGAASAMGDVYVRGATVRGTLNVDSPQRVFCANLSRLEVAFKTKLTVTTPATGPTLVFVDCILNAESTFDGFALSGPAAGSTLTINTTTVTPPPAIWTIPGVAFDGMVTVVGSNALSLSGVSFESLSSKLTVNCLAGVSFETGVGKLQGIIDGVPNARVTIDDAMSTGSITVSAVTLLLPRGLFITASTFTCNNNAVLSGPKGQRISRGSMIVNDCSLAIDTETGITGPSDKQTLTLDATASAITINSIDKWAGTIALRGSNQVTVVKSAAISSGDAYLLGSGQLVATITLGTTNGHVQFKPALTLLSGSAVAISATGSGTILSPSVLTLFGTAVLILTNIQFPKLMLSGTGSFELRGSCSADPLHFVASGFQNPINITDGTFTVEPEGKGPPSPPFTFTHGVAIGSAATLAIKNVLVTIPMGTLDGTVSSDSALNITASVGTCTITAPIPSPIDPVALTGTLTVSGSLTIGKKVKLASTVIIKPAVTGNARLVLSDGAEVAGGATLALNSITVPTGATVKLDVTGSSLQLDNLSWAGTLAVSGEHDIQLGPTAAKVTVPTGGGPASMTGTNDKPVHLWGSIASPSSASVLLPPSIVITDDQWLNFSAGIVIASGVAFTVNQTSSTAKLKFRYHFVRTAPAQARSADRRCVSDGPSTSSLPTTFRVADNIPPSLSLPFSWVGTVLVQRTADATGSAPVLQFSKPDLSRSQLLSSDGVDIIITAGALLNGQFKSVSTSTVWNVDGVVNGGSAVTLSGAMHWNTGTIRLDAASASINIESGVTVNGAASFGTSALGSLQLDGCEFNLSVGIPPGFVLSGSKANSLTVLHTSALTTSIQQSMKIAGGVEVRGDDPLALTVLIASAHASIAVTGKSALRLTTNFDDYTSELNLSDGLQLTAAAFGGAGSVIAQNVTFTAAAAVSFSGGVQIKSGAWGGDTKSGAILLNNCSVIGNASFLAPVTGPGTGATATISGASFVQFDRLTLTGGTVNAIAAGSVQIDTLNSAVGKSNALSLGSNTAFRVRQATLQGGDSWSISGGSVDGAFNLTDRTSSLAFGGGSVLQSSIGATGIGLVALDSCTISGGATIQTAQITGPAAGQRVMLKPTADAPILLPQLSGWGGEVRLFGAAGSNVELSNATISSKSAKLSYASSIAVPLTGSIDIAGFGLNIQSGRVSTAGTLRFKSSTRSATLALNSIEVSSANSLIVLGSGIVARPTLLTGLGTVQFDGCDVALPPYLDLFTGSLAGPSIGESTTIKISDATALPPFAVAGAVIIDVDSIVIEGATLQITFTELNMTESTASITTTATVRVPGSTEFVAPALTVQSGTLRGSIVAPPNTASGAPTELSITGTVLSTTELRISSGVLSGTVTIENGTAIRFQSAVIVDALTVQTAPGSTQNTIQFGDSDVRSAAVFPLAASFAGPLIAGETATFVLSQFVRSLAPFAHTHGTVRAVGTGALELSDYMQLSGAVLDAAGPIRVTRGALHGRTTVNGVYDPVLKLTDCVVSGEISALQSAEIDCFNTAFQPTASFTDSGDSAATPSVRLDACTIDPAVSIAPNIGFRVGATSTIGGSGQYRALTVQPNAALTLSTGSGGGLKLDSVTLIAPCSVTSASSKLLVIASKTASFEFAAPESIKLNGVSIEPTAECAIAVAGDGASHDIELSGGATIVAGSGLSISTPGDATNRKSILVAFRSDAGAVSPVSSVLLFGDTAFHMNATAALQPNTIQMDGVCYSAEAADNTLPAALNATGATANAKCTYFDGCASTPCAGGGKCHNRRASYECTCPEGFTGSACQTNINECASDPCELGGVCTDGANGYTCACRAGTTGVRCEINLNECASNPCLSGGTCVDRVNGFECTCAAGYWGPICAGELNECASSPCANGGSCVDGLGHFTCACRIGFDQPQCLTCSGCNTTVECVPTDATPNGMICACPLERTGAQCQYPVSTTSGSRIALAANEFEVVLNDEIEPGQLTPTFAAAIVAQLVTDAGAREADGTLPVKAATEWMYASAIRIDASELVHIWVTVVLAKWTGDSSYPIERLTRRIGSGDATLAGLNILSFSYGSNHRTVLFGESSGFEPVTVIAGPSFSVGSERAKTALILLAVFAVVVLVAMHYLQSRYPNSRPSEFGATLFYTANFISNLPFLVAAAALTTAAAQTTSGPVQASAPQSYVVAGGLFVALALAFNIAAVIYVFITEAANNPEFGPVHSFRSRTC